jgi:hypothetical protein
MTSYCGFHIGLCWAIDETHISARVPKDMHPAFRGRKYYTTQNVLASLDFVLKYTYVLDGWEVMLLLAVKRRGPCLLRRTSLCCLV